MKKFFYKKIQAANVILNLALLFVCAYMFLRGVGMITEALYPLPALIIALFFTLMAFDQKVTGALAIFGIALYLSSWMIIESFGIWPAMIVWAIGLSIWFYAVCQSIAEIRNLKPCCIAIK